MNTSSWLVYYYRDVIMFSVYGNINMMMMILLWDELKLNRNRVAIEIYTKNWKKDHFQPVSYSALSVYS